jgi:uncharacterized protein (TIGR00255 family)
MLNSMTGYGSCRAEKDGREINVEIKSVNHKFFECSVRAGRQTGFLEDRVKKFLAGFISRGKVDVNINISTAASGDINITADNALIDGYINALRNYADTTNIPVNIKDDLSYSVILRIPDAFIAKKNLPDEETLWADVKAVLSEAFESFSAMRKAEGEKLLADVADRLNAIEEYVNIIDVISPESAVKYRNKLTERLNEIISGKADESRILTEAAIFAEKTAVFEETVRLKSHIEQFRGFLLSDVPIGRKMDFLTQEMNREANTIGSKAQDLEITRIVLEIKSDIEKIREQVQNIE